MILLPFQSLKGNSALGVSDRLANPLQSKKQWRQVFCGDGSILFTHLSTLGFAHQDTFPGLFSSCWVYGLEVEWWGFWWLWAL